MSAKVGTRVDVRGLMRLFCQIGTQQSFAGGGRWHHGRLGSFLKGRSSSFGCSALNSTPQPGGVGFNEKGRKTLAHPDFDFVQRMWHPTRNQGKTPADYLFGSSEMVRLRCPGCIHGCGRHHEWEATANALTMGGGRIVCPFCESKGGKFCPCRSVAADARLSKEWHPENPPAESVSISSRSNVLWKCLKGHPDYEASCKNRSIHNTGCPACFQERQGKVRHPVLSEGRPDLASQWHPDNGKAASEVRLGSHFRAWWVCPNDANHPP